MATKAETINQLKELGYSDNDILGKSKKELEDLVLEVKAVESVIENAEEIKDDSLTDSLQPFTTAPELTPSSPEWSDYVLSLLDEKKEIVLGNPKTEGLRRVADSLFGGIVGLTTDIIDSPNVHNNYRATVKVRVEFGNGTRYDGAADVYSGNTEKTYAIHSIATAETRAEGRALRKALRLVQVLAAEELIGPDKDEPTGFDSRASTEMVAALKNMANKAKVDIVRLANVNNIKVDTVEQLTKDHILILSDVIRKITVGEIAAPDEAKVYG